MIKFFRKIRQKLLSENKFSRYLIYAIGEIVLVVIGILIALSINNWNESEKQKSKEIEILTSMSALLGKDQNSIEKIIPYNKRIRNSIDIILERLNSDLPYQDSLKYTFGNTITYWFYYTKTSVFENLKSEGVNLISNKSLRQEIIDFYDDSGRYSTRVQADNYRQILENASQNLLNTRFNSFWDGNYEDWILQMENNFGKQDMMDIRIEMVPNDFEALKKDEKYLYFLRSLKNINSWYMDRMFRARLIGVKELRKNIESELELLK